MTVKVDAAPDDVEKHIQNGGGVPSKEDAANQDVFGKEKIVSLYLAQQGSHQDTREKYRSYLENSETMRATRRKQLFKQNNYPTEDAAVDTFDYSVYHKRACVSAVPKSPTSEICGCNKPMSDPSHNYHPPGETEWSYTQHTELHPTDAYGRVKFSSYQKAKYVRVDADSNPGDIANLVQNVFNLSIPGVIISLKGSLLGFSVTSKVEKVIQRGIMKAAITTNGWLTTSGIDAGCVMSIGEALRIHNHTVPCIGFSSWGCLPDVVKEALVVPPENEGEYTCSYPRIKVKPGSHVENLEPNHSHHILSDTGAISDWGTESTLRANWEAYMRDELNIPVVMVVMQGSIGASNFLLEGLRAGTPAVVIHGSGGICDVVVNLVRHLKAVRNQYYRARGIKKHGSRRGSISEYIEVCTCSYTLSMTCPVSVQTINSGNFDKFTKDNKRFLDNVYEIVTEYEDRLILFDLDDENYDGLDAALLEALVTAQKVHETKQAGNTDSDEQKSSSNNLSGVQVALGWNRPDFAERLLKADNSSKDELALGSILLHALAWNLHEFTELLLSHDASIPMVAANAVVLYNTSKRNDHLKRFVRYSLRCKNKNDDFTKETIDKMINKLASSGNNFVSDVSNESDPYFELLVWAVLSLNPEIASLMWKGTQEPIRAALFVVMILKRLCKAHKVIANANEKATIEGMLDNFEGKAIAILDTLLETDATVCERALNSVWARLGNMTYIDMAFKSRAKEFIAHPGCQDICENRWKRGLASEVNIVSVILTTICPILLFTGFISFKSEVTKNCNSAWKTFITKLTTWFNSPNVKFWFGVVMYMIFVLLQTHVVFTRMGRNTTSFSPLKIVYLVWFGMLIVDEVMQVANLSFKDWLRDMFNKVDMIMYLTMTAGVVLVHIPIQTTSGEGVITYKDSYQYYDAGRIFLSLGSILFYLRILHMFTLDAALGPTILMITKMMGDFRVFMLMFFVVAVAFGVGYAVALTDPEDWVVNEEYGENTGSYIAGIFFYTYFQMFGEIFVEDLTENGPFFNVKKVESRHGFVIGLVGVYMAIVVLMLVNILIAMFSDTYTRIKDKEDVIFKYQRLELLLDIENSLLPPPFSFLHIVISKITNCSRGRKSPFCHDRWKDTVIRSAVVDCLEEYLKKERTTKSSETEALLRESTRTLKNKMYKLQRYVENLQSSVDSVTNNPANAAMFNSTERVEDV